MKSNSLLTILIFCAVSLSSAQNGRTKIDLNGTWDFEQTKTAFPPYKYTQKIPVPGLVHLAVPKIDQYDLLFSQQRANGSIPISGRPDYKPMYYWYRRVVFIPEDLKGQYAVLTILKSQYVTQIYVNGVDVGSSISCFTPIDLPVTDALRYGQPNEILIRVGDHQRQPSAAAGGIDNEKINYTPGIWDNVELTFTGGYRVHRILMLPSLKDKKVTVKLLVRSLLPARQGYGVALLDTCHVHIIVKEKNTGRQVGAATGKFSLRGDMITPFEISIPVTNPRAWDPEDPFLYVADVRLSDESKTTDQVERSFGIRDFERLGKYFYLNGKKIMLRGTNIAFHRFLNDPQCANLPWDKEWVTRLLIDIPKKLHWNTIRNTIGILPQFWYDIADEMGIMLQNEWFYWQVHGWDEQIRLEYTDWVWSDGNHPSIVIWDAMNEFKDDYIGNILIPELKQLDPTRIWDNGYMEATELRIEDDMDESHTYNHQLWLDTFRTWITNSPVPIGDLNYWPDFPQKMNNLSAAQVVNEYGWIWLWRNGMPSPHSPAFYECYLGTFNNASANRELQGYDLQWETELFRVHRAVAGVMAFSYLSDNYGATGDWFIDDIRDLEPGPTLFWFQHCFAPAAVFIDLTDQRYTKHVKPFKPGSTLVFNLIGVNDYAEEVRGIVKVNLLDSKGEKVISQSFSITIPAYLTQLLPVAVQLPDQKGGYLLIAEFTALNGKNDKPAISRRYIKIGDCESYNFFELKPGKL